MQLPLFDKYINLTFTRIDGSKVTIKTPDTGRKPSIRLSGAMYSSSVVQDIELRLWNFVPDMPLSSFGSLEEACPVEISAGYRGDLHTSIKGSIINSFNETPGPDSVTCFQMQMGLADDWITTTITENYPAGTLLESVLQDVAKKFGLSLKYYLPQDPAVVLPIAVGWNGLAKDFLGYLEDLFKRYDPASKALRGVKISPWSDELVCSYAGQGTGIITELKYISHANHGAPGVDIQCPWVPMLRPGDTVRVDPKYFRQDLSGSAVGPMGNTFVVYGIDFQFATDTDENTMVIRAVNTQQVAQ